MNKLLRLFSRQHRPDIEALSAQLDGRLEAAPASALGAHLSSCDACRTVLEKMRATRAMLRAMPEADVPRSFRLRQADVEEAPRVTARPSPMLRWSPVAAGVAAAAFVVVLGADLATRDSGGGAHLASREADQRTGLIQDDSGFSQEASKDAATGASQSDDFDGSGGGAIRPPDTGTSIPAASGPPSEASNEVPLAAAPTPDATEAPVEAMIPADTAAGPDTAPQPAVPGAPETGTDAAAPAGPAPDGDVNVPAPGVAAPEVSTPPAGAIPPDVAATEVPASRVEVRPSATAAGEITALANESDEGDSGNRTGFLIVEIAAAAAAVASGVTFVAWRTRRRGVAR